MRPTGTGLVPGHATGLQLWVPFCLFDVDGREWGFQMGDEGISSIFFFGKCKETEK